MYNTGAIIKYAKSKKQKKNPKKNTGIFLQRGCVLVK